MENTSKTNEFSMAGWLAIAAATLTLPMFALSIGLDIVAKREPEMISALLPPYLLVVVCHTVFSIYAFLKFRTLLNHRHDFHDVDRLMTVIVAGIIIITLIAVPVRLLNTLGDIGLPIILGFFAFLFVAGVIMGTISIIFALRLLHLESDLNGFLKPYAYLTIAAAACFALFITAPLGMIIDAIANIVLAMIFLRPRTEPAQPDFV